MIIEAIARRLTPAVGVENESSREKWLKDTLLTIPPGRRILDAGAGTQQYRKYCSHLEYTSQDFGKYDGKGDTSALQTQAFDYGKLDIVSDITSIPEPDSSFDAIMCTEVLEHLPDPCLAMMEFSRLLKPGGHVILTAPFCSLTHFSPFHFASGFNRYWYESILGTLGFQIVEISSNGNFFEYLAQELHRIPGVSSRYSNDKPGILETLATTILLRMLFRFSRKDTGSSELLCFGYHVHARKAQHKGSDT